jgi:hypothetical protein
VLRKESLPKSPLGVSLIGAVQGRRVRPDAFGANSGQRVEIPITSFARALVAFEGTGTAPTSTLALLSAFEPISIAFASFHGPGSPDEPRLRLILTIGPPVELP